ncbi:hypothetical protein OTU49_017118, partial [Cherax quadricarinatus]
VLRLDEAGDVLLCGGVSALLSSTLHLLGLFSTSCWLLFTTLWLLSAATILLLSAVKVSSDGKVVVVTGCDTGFGNALALHLHNLGFRVVACCLREEGEGVQRLRDLKSPRLHLLQLDVTSQDQLKTTLSQVKNLIPEGEVLWGLVNNAGVSTFGEVEWVPEATYRKVLEVNLLGTVFATKTFLPLIRRTRGRVVNIASMYGRMGNTMRAPYVLSKYAVEGFTDCLRQEMKVWGVKVCLVEPGNYVAATNIFTDESVRQQAQVMWTAMTEEVQQDFPRSYFDSQVNLMMSYTNAGTRDVNDVVEAMTAALTQKYPRARYLPMDVTTRIRIFVATHLPEWVYDTCYITTARPHLSLPNSAKP